MAPSAGMSVDDPLRSFRHDVRSPLNSVLGFAILLEDELDGEQLESIRHIRRSAEQILALVDALGPTAVAGRTDAGHAHSAAAANESTPGSDRAMARMVEGEISTILLVEDNRSNVRLVERVLAHRPSIELAALHDLAELRRWIDEPTSRPDLILLDRHLGADDALVVLPALIEANPGVPVVVVTADATEVARDEAIIAGAVDVLTKPFSVSGLLAIVDDQLSSSSSASGSKR